MNAGQFDVAPQGLLAPISLKGGCTRSIDSSISAGLVADGRILSADIHL